MRIHIKMSLQGTKGEGRQWTWHTKLKYTAHEAGSGEAKYTMFHMLGNEWALCQLGAPPFFSLKKRKEKKSDSRVYGAESLSPVLTEAVKN